MISTLQELIAPATQSEFFALLRDRKLTFRRANGENRYAGPIDWPTLRGIVESGAVEPDLLRVTRRGYVVHKTMYSDNGKVNVPRLGSLIPQGVSIVVNQLEKYAPAVNALCQDIRAVLNEGVIIIAVMTSGAGGAFRLHYDRGDVLVLQIEGRKRWRIYDSPVVNPAKHMKKPEPPATPPIFDEVLQPGNFLVLPTGYWHHCDNGPEISLHLSCLIQPRQALQALRAIEHQLADDELFRAPLLRMDPVQRAAHEAALKARLIKLIGEASFSDIVTGLKDRPVKDAAEEEHL